MSYVADGTRTPHPELDSEQQFLQHAYACLRFMRDRAVRLKELGYLGGDVSEGGPTPETLAKWMADKQRRIDDLAESPSALCFGRTDRLDDQRLYIGRRHVEDENGQAVVVDWRAPSAVPFYRATVVDPMKLRRRRRFLLDGRQLIDLLDEDLENPDAEVAGAYVPDPLLADIERARGSEMRDIVATIQAEQDVIIRAPLEECVVVQGGPGTGKTAVGLHRAAFLLYTHRTVFQRERLLVVGPNKVFLRYISQVLPSLGETAAVQLTVDALAGARFVVRGRDDPPTARLKGDARMAEVVQRAVLARVKAPRGPVPLRTAFGPVTLPAEAVSGIVEEGRTSGRPANQTRTILRDRLVKLAWDRYLERRPGDFALQPTFTDGVRASRELKVLLDQIWPTRSAPDVVRQLYGNRRIRQAATAGLLTPDEQERLARKPAARLAQEPWSAADLAILHEAEAATNGIQNTYGHIVVDEAQDLSAMQLRMLGRRSRRGSFTVLGDLAQSTEPAGQTSWEHVADQLAASTASLQELSIGYRVPAPILDYANRLLPGAAPGVRPASSARHHGHPPRLVAVTPAGRAAAVVEEARQLSRDWTSLGIVTPGAVHDEVVAGLEAATLEFVDEQRVPALGEHITVLLPSRSKGLEFDAVIVVEPARIADGGPNTLRLLYVVLTRAVQHLSVVHAEGLPVPLADTLPAAG